MKPAGFYLPLRPLLRTLLITLFMKTILRSLFVAFISTGLSTTVFSQFYVQSTNGYAVTVSLTPVAVVPTSSGCVNGFNYNVKLNYSIAFSGNNIPSQLWTLQANLGCTNGNQFFGLPVAGGVGNMTNNSRVWVGTATCATATLQSLGCANLQLIIQGPGINYRTISAPVSIGLPVTWQSFDATLIGSRVKLDWITASEQNNDYFTVERSQNGTDWTTIETIKGAGNSAGAISYNAFDEAPLTGNSFYRIRQTDIDGRISYTDTRVIKNTNAAATGISVFPVPNTGNSITISGINANGNHELSVLNTSGTPLYTAKLQRNKVDLPALKAGLYFIKITDKITGEVSTQRYVKL